MENEQQVNQTINQNQDTQPIQDATEQQASIEHAKKGRFKDWWKNHKPSKRRVIQVYAALLYNCYIKGYISGEIFKGMTKVACVPGLNCYSCPGAIGACPLGSLQNALSGTKTRTPYYVFGILLLYGVIFGRTICGWLCPVGLGQDLLYKIKTPKAPKSKASRVCSYLKYVLLALLVFGIPIIYALDQTVVPGFCKYICPAGTFGGAILLLLHPENASMFSLLGPLFTWKMIVLVLVMTGCIFIYRMFCRFLCPLGAIYGFFNKFALLGIKLDKSKCIDCGKCITTCKMDIKHVGDHECINCGECVGVCPTKAISWRGGKIFLKDADIVDGQTEQEAQNQVGEQAPIKIITSDIGNDGEFLSPKPLLKKKSDKKVLAIKITCLVLAIALFVGVFTYANFFVKEEQPSATYVLVVSQTDSEKTGLISFALGDVDDYVQINDGGMGTKENPFILESPLGKYDIPINAVGQRIYLTFTTYNKITAQLKCNADLHLEVYYVFAGKNYKAYDSVEWDTDIIKFGIEKPNGFGNTEGTICYDFSLKGYNGVEEITLSDYRGKVVVVNFWGIWCGPCKLELPDFEQVKVAYSEDVEVIAIHSYSEMPEVQAFLDSQHWNEWNVLFAQDTGNSNGFNEIFSLLGGRNNTYPRTLIVDREGVIRYVYEGAISYEMLEDAVKSLK